MVLVEHDRSTPDYLSLTGQEMIAKCHCFVALLFAIVGFVDGIRCANAEDSAHQSELKKLEGLWITISDTWRGTARELRVEELLKIDGNKMTFTRGSQRESATFSLNPKANPKEIDMIRLDGPANGVTFPAIYEINAEELKLSVPHLVKDWKKDANGQLTNQQEWKKADRPKTFEDTASHLIILKRKH